MRKSDKTVTEISGGENTSNQAQSSGLDLLESQRIIAVLEENQGFRQAAQVLKAAGGSGKIILIYSGGRLQFVNSEISFKG